MVLLLLVVILEEHTIGTHLNLSRAIEEVYVLLRQMLVNSGLVRLDLLILLLQQGMNIWSVAHGVVLFEITLELDERVVEDAAGVVGYCLSAVFQLSAEQIVAAPNFILVR